MWLHTAAGTAPLVTEVLIHACSAAQVLFPDSYAQTTEWVRSSAEESRAVLGRCQQRLQQLAAQDQQFQQLAAGVKVRSTGHAALLRCQATQVPTCRALHVVHLLRASSLLTSCQAAITALGAGCPHSNSTHALLHAIPSC